MNSFAHFSGSASPLTGCDNSRSMRAPIDTLTRREREILDLLRRGLTNEEIAARLGISLDGAKYHVSQILSKLGVATREEAADVALGERRRWWAAWPLWAKIAGAATVAAAVGGLAVLAWAAIWTSEPVEEIAGEQIASPTAVATPTSPINPTLAPLAETLSGQERDAIETVLELIKDVPCDHPDASSAKATLTTMDGARRMVREQIIGDEIGPNEKPQRIAGEVSDPPPDSAPVWVVEIRHDISERVKPGDQDDCGPGSRSTLWLYLVVDGEVPMSLGN